MKTIDLKMKSPTVNELLAMAHKRSLLLVAKDGTTFVLEEADDFDHEIAMLGSSAKFMRFLKERSKEPASISIEQFAEELEQKTRK